MWEQTVQINLLYLPEVFKVIFLTAVKISDSLKEEDLWGRKSKGKV